MTSWGQEPVRAEDRNGSILDDILLTLHSSTQTHTYTDIFTCSCTKHTEVYQSNGSIKVNNSRSRGKEKITHVLYIKETHILEIERRCPDHFPSKCTNQGIFK